MKLVAWRRVLCLIVIYTLAGCAVWRPISPNDLQETLADGRTSRVRVILQDSVVVLNHARLSGDALVGTPDRKGERSTVSMRLEDLQRVEVRRPNTTASRHVAIGVLCSAVILAILVTRDSPMR